MSDGSEEENNKAERSGESSAINEGGDEKSHGDHAQREEEEEPAIMDNVILEQYVSSKVENRTLDRRGEVQGIRRRVRGISAELVDEEEVETKANGNDNEQNGRDEIESQIGDEPREPIHGILNEE